MDSTKISVAFIMTPISLTEFCLLVVLRPTIVTMIFSEHVWNWWSPNREGLKSSWDVSNRCVAIYEITVGVMFLCA
jgi:hypothetical protein